MRCSLAVVVVYTMFWVAAPSRGDVVYSTPGSTYSQSFDSLASSGTPAWSDDTTITGWFSNRTTYLTGSGTSGTGGLYSFGTSSERALGGVASGSADPVQYGVRLTNSTGVTLYSVSVTYDGEQWRKGNNNDAHVLDFAYVLGEAPTLATSGYIDVNGLDFTSPIIGAAGGATALDGNAAANRVAGITSTINLTWLPGQELFLRWTDVDNGGVDHGLAIDSVSVVAAVPETSAFAFGGAVCLVAGVLSAWQRRRREEALA
jgi:hypothetical protein